MGWLNTPPLTVGQADTNGLLAQDLGQAYIFRGGVSATNPVVCLRAYRLVKNNSGATLAAGAALIEQRTSGVRNGNVTTTTTAAHPDGCGSVPAEFGTNTVAIDAYFLMQISGPARVQSASTAATYIVQVTSTASSVFGTATTAGYFQLISVATTTLTLDLIGAYQAAAVGKFMNSAVVTAAGQLADADLSIRL